MNIKQKVITLAIVLASTVSLAILGSSGAMAQQTCGGVKTSVIQCNQGGGKAVADTGAWGLLLVILNIMTGGVGILAVGGIVYASILYTTAEDRAEQTKKAIQIIANIVLGVIAYGAMYILLNFIVPGGIFS
jgi:hypothetical protein